jgi:hypothetical protein
MRQVTPGRPRPLGSAGLLSVTVFGGERRPRKHRLRLHRRGSGLRRFGCRRRRSPAGPGSQRRAPEPCKHQSGAKRTGGGPEKFPGVGGGGYARLSRVVAPQGDILVGEEGLEPSWPCGQRILRTRNKTHQCNRNKVFWMPRERAKGPEQNHPDTVRLRERCAARRWPHRRAFLEYAPSGPGGDRAKTGEWTGPNPMH